MKRGSIGFASACLLFAATASGAAGAEVADPCAGIDPILAGSSFVLLRAPAAGERIATGTAIAGCSRTHEGNVGFRLLGRDGRLLASGHATGGGFAGAAPFRFTVAFEVPLPERGTLELFEPRVTGEGTPPPSTSIPVVLAAGSGPGAIELPLFARYAGSPAGGDATATATELILYGDLTGGPRRFRLREPQLPGGAASPTGSTRELEGAWQFGLGSGELANAIVIRLEIEGGESRAYVVRERELFRLGSDGRPIESPAEPRLLRLP